MDEVRLDMRKCHMVCSPFGALVYWTASRKQKQTIGIFEQRYGRSWQDAVADGYRVMKCFVHTVDKTDQSLPSNGKGI